MSEEIKLLKGIIRIQTMLRGWMARRKYHNVQVKLYDNRVNKILKEFSL